MRTRIISICVLALSSITLTTLPHHAQAALTTLYLSGPKNVTLGQTFFVRLLLNSANPINAISGNIRYSGELLEMQAVNYQRSIFALWQQTPNHSPQTNQLVFTGGLPNPGFTGENGEVVQVAFKARALGTATIQLLSNSQVLLNDGQGSSADWSTSPYVVQIHKAITEPTPPPTELAPSQKDTTPPSNLELLIGHDSNLFEGAWFAVFQAEDKESGIDYYEIAELDSNQTYPTDTNWRKANSPYRLLKQEQNTKVFLKAVDKSGNVSVISEERRLRSISLPTQNWHILLMLSIILGLGLVLPIFVYHRKKLEAPKQK